MIWIGWPIKQEQWPCCCTSWSSACGLTQTIKCSADPHAWLSLSQVLVALQVQLSKPLKPAWQKVGRLPYDAAVRAGQAG